MKLRKINSEPTVQRYNQMIQDLEGYWKSDRWYAFDCPLYTNETKIKNSLMTFEQVSNTGLKNELKFYFFNRLTNSVLRMSTVWSNTSALNKLIGFISISYSEMTSILDVPYERFSMHFKSNLIQEGKNSLTIKGYLQLYNRIYAFFHNWYDERSEIEKDIWDVRKLGIDYNRSKPGDYLLNFNSVPIPFRKLVKRYIERRVLIQESLSWGSAFQNIAKLPSFFNYIHKKYPDWNGLSQLSRTDIEEFIKHLRSNPMGGNSNHKNTAPSNNYINRSVSFLETFMTYIQAYEWDESPTKPVRLLFFPEDKPKLASRISDQIKYISDFVWNQVTSHIEKVPKDIQTIVVLLEATGFRISDICALKMDCLTRKEDGWWIVGEQRKVKHQNHRVPISEEVAMVVLTQQEITKRKSTSEINPFNYLFPTYTGTRKGGYILCKNYFCRYIFIFILLER